MDDVKQQQIDNLRDLCLERHGRQIEEGQGAILHSKRGYLGVFPNFLTAFSERAYVFSSLDEAQKMIIDFPLALDGFEASELSVETVDE